LKAVAVFCAVDFDTFSAGQHGRANGGFVATIAAIGETIALLIEGNEFIDVAASELPTRGRGTAGLVFATWALGTPVAALETWNLTRARASNRRETNAICEADADGKCAQRSAEGGAQLLARSTDDTTCLALFGLIVELHT